MIAFQDALDSGATHLETDVRATADGVAVLMHDAEFDPDHDRVADLTLAALRNRLPHLLTLAEALRALPQARFNIDVKAQAAVTPVVSDIRASAAADRVLVTSFARRRSHPVVRALEPVATSPSAAPAALGVLAAAGGVGPLLRLALHGVDALQVPERILGVRLDSPGLLTRVHAAGAEVHVWVVNDAARMRALVAAGVDGIVTDRPDLAAEVVG
ncbi:glycerophosphodiester phosphodiesterase family protein [uncultured Amnibacterium sp.]|uniref:glycerophosphodiester phosphodiesterase family protein n=1 Tax=uncultured Amnibacterium sp. TaxID=1631851 RepID=UPI0035CA163D